MYAVHCRSDMEHSQHTIYIHPEAPTKVPMGAPCNGCGVCCLYAPCPLGVVLSGRRTGACDALRWDAALARYRCGAIEAPPAVTLTLPKGLRWLAPAFALAVRRLGPRWIAAGAGCDSSLEVMVPLENHCTDAPASASTTMPSINPHDPANTAAHHPTEP